MLELERSLMELHQIFLDMAVLVEAQGEMLDNIETQARSGVRGMSPKLLGGRHVLTLPHPPSHTHTHTRWPRRTST